MARRMRGVAGRGNVMGKEKRWGKEEEERGSRKRERGGIEKGTRWDGISERGERRRGKGSRMERKEWKYGSKGRKRK